MFKDLNCSDLGPDDYADIKQIFVASFVVAPDTNPLQPFIDKMDRVLLMYDGGKPAAFMFFSFKSVNGMRLLNPGLSGKMPQTKNALKILASYIVVRYFLLNPLWLTQNCGAIVIANNSRSYQTLADAGIPIYPNIYEPEKSLDNIELYREALKVMKLEGVTDRCLLPNSLTKAGFGMKKRDVSYDKLNKKGQIFMDYIDRDPENGLVALAIGRPLFDAPPYYIKLAAKTLRKRLLETGPQWVNPLSHSISNSIYGLFASH